jgi:hypothetical protein
MVFGEEGVTDLQSLLVFPVDIKYSKFTEL